MKAYRFEQTLPGIRVLQRPFPGSRLRRGKQNPTAACRTRRIVAGLCSKIMVCLASHKPLPQER
jgi:hypothetical protein